MEKTANIVRLMEDWNACPAKPTWSKFDLGDHLKLGSKHMDNEDRSLQFDQQLNIC